MTLDPDEILARIDGTVPLIQPVDAVEKRAHLFQRHPEDYYIEPEFCSERLFATEHFEGTIVDPSCGSGRIVLAARAHRERVSRLGDNRITKALGYDIVKRSKVCNEDLEDFLTSDYETANIVSNPPFGLCGKASTKNGLKEDFAYVKKALATAEKKVALLLPLPWLTGADKGEWLRTTPLA